MKEVRTRVTTWCEVGQGEVGWGSRYGASVQYCMLYVVVVGAMYEKKYREMGCTIQLKGVGSTIDPVRTEFSGTLRNVISEGATMEILFPFSSRFSVGHSLVNGFC